MTALYDEVIPQLDKMLGNLSGWLDAAKTWAEAREIDPESLLDTRLFPDMFPLRRQIQSACDGAKLTAARLVATEAPKHEDGPQSIAELQARIAEVRSWITAIDADAVVADRILDLPFGPGMRAKLEDFAREFSMPNFYFHLNMAYALLRSVGVPLGKRAYIGSITLQ